ncbi:hypothetical protein NPX13_g2622 [Xylaria arbuscula]|uniref:Citrate transporter-like domain-containing protein n=1 Tax=Xylaria arbuscula TaxID=114810 RepID=A0A9W8NK27_9PEZI|nr:hypothetical protein NPX13_g2622 [Xylaria arbuscula]
MEETVDLDTSQITHWRNIFTLVVFVIANITVLFPFHIPLPIPLALYKAVVKSLVHFRIIPARRHYDRRKFELNATDRNEGNGVLVKSYVWFHFPINFVTGPLIADLFLLAIGAIGKREVRGGIAGSDNIVPYDILIFFFSLAYIAISIDASGLIRWLAFKVLQLGGKVGHRLFFYLYAFFFGLGSFIGNDPIILSGTAFLAYMTRVSSNIVHPRAWIHTQFAVANIASAILVSSNPTNLVLAGAFNIKFINYTRDMVVPVVITAILLFPFLLYIVFANESLIPSSIEMHELDAEARSRKPVNPNIPFGRGTAGEEEKRLASNEAGQQLSLEEIMNPFLDKAGAAVGGLIMAATLVAIIVLNEVLSSKNKETHVFYVTLPAAFLMLSFDLAWGWHHRDETRRIARDGRQQVAEAEERRKRELAAEAGILAETRDPAISLTEMPERHNATDEEDSRDGKTGQINALDEKNAADSTGDSASITPSSIARPEPSSEALVNPRVVEDVQHKMTPASTQKRTDTQSTEAIEEKQREVAGDVRVTKTTCAPTISEDNDTATLVSVSAKAYRWTQDTFPTVVAVLSHLPFALLPFSFEMFILVQGLVTNGWVPVFAYGWDHWVHKTGTIGAIGGMGFLSVILCNFAGTNIGTTILLSRVIQAWEEIHKRNMQPIGDRTKWATIYAMGPSASTTAPLASRSAHPSPDCSGAISSGESISACAGSSSPASICLSLVLL